MRNLILLKFNNYYDRNMIRYETIHEYINKYPYHILNNTNFDEKDGVYTEHVFNDVNFEPSYLLVVDENQEILSRWFIIEWKKIRGKQHIASLKLDAVAQYFNKIKNAPIFVEKAMLDVGDPFIFNHEDMTYNQIKKKETLLKDKTNISWLCGFYNQNNVDAKTYKTTRSFIEGGEPPINIEDINKNVILNYDNDDKTTYAEISNYVLSFYSYRNSIISPTIINIHCDKEKKYDFTFDFNMPFLPSNFAGLLEFENSTDARSKRNEFASKYLDTKKFIDLIAPSISSVQDKYVESLNGRVAVDSKGNTFRLEVNKIDGEIKPINSLKGSQASNEFIALLQKYFPDNYKPKNLIEGNIVLQLDRTQSTYIVRAVPTSVAKDSLEVLVDDRRNHLNDAPYDMFCIPYVKDKLTRVMFDTGVGLPIELDSDASLLIARALASQGGGVGNDKTNVYDVQLLPYCPIREVRDAFRKEADGTMVIKINDVDGFKINKDYTTIDNKIGEGPTTGSVSVMFWATESSGTFDIIYYYKEEDDPIELKVENETTFLRICSPNYSGIFEFSPAMNGGVNRINVDYTYKPFNSYIHLNPNFRLLYGKDFNDSRGLIVGGDFSIATMTNAWESYQLNNKNYQQMFDREIKSLETNHGINFTKNTINSTLGVLGGIVGGGLVGGAKGGVGGAIGGAVMGGIAPATSMATNLTADEFAHKEQVSFKTDMYNYTLQNIQALPDGIAKTTAFTFNNKVFPFIEEYSCTETEKNALRQKIKYNGMKVMRIGTIEEFYKKDRRLYFFKGQLIRVNDYVHDYHVATVIFDELNKGVYIYGQ